MSSSLNRKGKNMALVSDGFQLNVTMLDTAGDTTILGFALNSATAAAAATDAGLILASLALLSDAVVSAYSVGEKFIESALVYPVDAEVEDEAFFVGKIIGFPNKSGNFRIPAPVDAMFVSPTGPGHNIVNMAYGALATYLTYFDGSGPILVSDGESLVTSSVTGKRRKKGTKSG